jgi:hypothetical protein
MLTVVVGEPEIITGKFKKKWDERDIYAER